MYPAPQARPPSQASSNGPQGASTTVTSKGTVITRYAPPPGYKGPAAAPPSSHPRRQSTQLPPGYGYNPASVPNFSASPYGGPSAGYQAQSYMGHNGQYQTATSYYPQGAFQGYPQQPNYTPQPSYPQQSAYPQQNGYPPQTGYPPQSNQPQPQPQAQQPANSYPATSAYQVPSSATSSTSPRRHSSVSASGGAQMMPQPTTHYEGARIADPAKEVAMTAAQGIGRRRSKSDTIHPDQVSEWALSDPCEECCAVKREEVDKLFDLPLLVWNAALPTNSPLPPTFREAELEALAPRKPKAHDEPVSEYFSKEAVDAQLNSIRHSEQWPEIKDDLMFKELSEHLGELISRTEMLKQYRVRFDPHWVQQPEADASAGAMDFAYDSYPDTDPLHDLQQALSNSSRRGSHPYHRPASQTSNRPASQASNRPASRTSHRPLSRASNRPESRTSHRRSTSVQSNTSTTSRYRALHPVRDSEQEDLLAQLGVTGSPKTVYETPGPAFGPPAPSSRPGSRQNSVGPPAAGSRYQPAYTANPPIYEESPRAANGWDATPRQAQYAPNGYTHQRSGSQHSQRTAAGSDFDVAGLSDDEATPRPKAKNGRAGVGAVGDNRKRGHLEDEETPRQRRKQQRVSGVWER